MPDEQEIFGYSVGFQHLAVKGCLSRPEIDSFQSGANLEHSYPVDFSVKADLFRRSWWNLQIEGNIEGAFPPPITVAEILAIHDKRSFTPKEPNVRLNWTVTVPATSESVFSSFYLNADIEQIVLDIPDLDGGTLKIQLLDEIGTVLYESGSQAENQQVAILLTADTRIPLIGQPTVKLLLSPTSRATDSVIRVFLYGR